MDSQFQKIDQFLMLVNTTKGKGLESLILHLLSDQDLYSFSQFLKNENIQELNSEQNPSRNYYDLLKIFAYGNYADYIENEAKLPALSENQMKKLRKLTILELAAKNKTLFYDELFKKVGLKSEIELEELVIEMIYQDLIVCMLDQRNREIKVSSCKGRDIKPKEINEIKTNLRSILEKTLSIEKMLQSKIDFLNAEKIKHLEQKKTVKKQEEEVKVFTLGLVGKKDTPKPLQELSFRGETRK